ncbi:MAG: nucleoside deaminase [Clostridia bacterium]|nr:nucleoside deaminase [Clostridia bacterium]
MSEHEKYMAQALLLAREAMDEGEVPVGCVIVRNGEIVGKGRNRREVGKNALAHAELEAINEACERLGGWRLPGCVMYVTLEPCPMCAGAVINARIEHAVIALPDAKSGSLGSVINLNSYPLNHKVKLTYGVLKDEAKEYMQSFFGSLRVKLKAHNNR